MSERANLGRRSLAALGWSYAGAAVRMLAQLVIQVVLARILGPQAYGQATIAFIVLGVGTNIPFGGASILIVVGVGLETVKQIESQLQQRHYEGFLR